MHRPLATALVVTAAIVTVPSLGFSAGVVHGGPAAKSQDVATRTLSPAKKKARAQAMARCRKIEATPKRKACIRKVKRKYARIEPGPVEPAGPVEEVDVRDKYFAPTQVEIPKGGSVKWVWGDQNADPHNVTLLSGPRGVSPYDFETPLSPSVNYTFKRSFRVPGTYRFACSLHHLMTMTVEVKG